MIDLWDALNALYHMHYNYIGVLWTIQTRLQHLRKFSKNNFSKNNVFFNMAYLCRAGEDSCDFTLGMLICRLFHMSGSPRILSFSSLCGKVRQPIHIDIFLMVSILYLNVGLPQGRNLLPPLDSLPVLRTTSKPIQN